MTTKIPKSTLRKLSKFDHRTWCGALTPSEIVAIYEAGGMEKVNHSLVIAQRAKAKGDSQPMWCYFRPIGAVKKQLGEIAPKQRYEFIKP